IAISRMDDSPLVWCVEGFDTIVQRRSPVHSDRDRIVAAGFGLKRHEKALAVGDYIHAIELRDRDDAIETRVAGFGDFAQPAASEGREDHVSAQASTSGEWQRVLKCGLYATAVHQISVSGGSIAGIYIQIKERSSVSRVRTPAALWPCRSSWRCI